MSSDAFDEALAIAATGVFWVSDDAKASGSIVRESAICSVTTEGPLRSSRSLNIKRGEHGVMVTPSGDPEDHVADSIPMPLLGVLDNGLKIALLDAALRTAWFPGRQVFSGHRVLLGDNFAKVDQRFVSARIALPNPSIWTLLATQIGESSPVPFKDAPGQLCITNEDGELWIQLTVEDGLEEREWERRFWNRCVTLLRLWTDIQANEHRIQLRETADSDWLELVVVNDRPRIAIVTHDSLLPPARLSREVVQDALSLFDKLAPIPDIATTRLGRGATLEQTVLANSAALEGLHRGCHEGEGIPFPEIGRSGPIADAAAEAAATKAIELGSIPEEAREQATRTFRASFLHFNQPSFAERVEALLKPVLAIAPGLIGQNREHWLKMVKDARNLEAHRFAPLKNQKPSYYVKRIDDYFQLAISTGWVLRLSLLLHLGVEGDLIRRRLRVHEPFSFALANMDASRLAWPGSRLEEFRASFEGVAPDYPVLPAGEDEDELPAPSTS